VALVVMNPPANAGDIRDMSLIPGSGRSPRQIKCKKTYNNKFCRGCGEKGTSLHH